MALASPFSSPSTSNLYISPTYSCVNTSVVFPLLINQASVSRHLPKMATKAKLLSAALLLSFFFFSLSLANGMKDPELLQCKHQCKHLRRADEEEKRRCFQRCDEYYKEKRRRERARQGDCKKVLTGICEEDVLTTSLDPRAQLSRCQEKCDVLRGEQRQLCRLRCQHRWKREQERKGEEQEHAEEEDGDDDDDEEEDYNDDNNPYVFDDKHLTSRVKMEQGRVDVLDKFTNKSKLLRGIKNYRVAFLVANPLTFISPSHWDADAILFVARGRATIGVVHEEKTESFNVEFGDIVKVSAGTPIFMVNRDENQKLFIIKLLRTVNLAGEYSAFYGPGGRDPESFYPGFSWEILEAALNVRRERLERLFKQQDEGSIMKANKEQVKAISSHVQEEGGGFWPFAGEPRVSYNLIKRHRPSYTNRNGQLFEAGSRQYRPLHDLNIMLSFLNITNGSMSAPMYNSRVTTIAIVVNGEGKLEMVRHQESKQGKSSSAYQRISAGLRNKTIFIVPPAHPFVLLASHTTNLQILCFNVNAQGNIRYPLAGRRNIVKSMGRETNELAFKIKGREVERVFSNQGEEYFFEGPKEEKKEGRAYA